MTYFFKERKKLKPLILAYYLPQFHEIPENNLWWGKGFTEWTNINNCKEYFTQHKIRKSIQPLGQYMLLEDGVIEKQFEIAKEYKIDGFMIWDYWFGDGDRILEKPLEKILDDDINVDYCLAWANHSWMNKSKGILLKEQKYLGANDYTAYFNYLLPHFKRSNYLKINNKPIFSIFMPSDVLDLDVFIETFEKLAKMHGFAGIHWLAENSKGNEEYISFFNNYYNSGKLLAERRFRGINYFLEYINRKTKDRFKLGPFVYSFKKLDEISAKKTLGEKELPVIFSGWDSSIRHDTRGIILNEFDEASFDKHLESIKKQINENVPVIILKSWNEWAEGNLLEPDSIFGLKLLEILREKFK